MSSSVSFRITRTAEDLAETIAVLSQKLVKLEQRQEALERQLQQQKTAQYVADEELAALEGIEQQLRDTRALLETRDEDLCLDEDLAA
ncbi:chemotaxis protein [Parasynechococcus sp.]|uniref:chemotaxis protein n=1 Tax=Parasynechococcus sp. TaxID=3101203 RepID=UPI0037038A2B